MKKNSLVILGILLLGLSSIFLLYVKANKTNDQPHDFLRQFLPNFLSEPKTLDMGYNSYYIAGSTSNNIYLGTVAAQLHLLISNTSLADTQHVQLKIK